MTKNLPAPPSAPLASWKETAFWVLIATFFLVFPDRSLGQCDQVSFEVPDAGYAVRASMDGDVAAVIQTGVTVPPSMEGSRLVVYRKTGSEWTQEMATEFALERAESVSVEGSRLIVGFPSRIWPAPGGQDKALVYQWTGTNWILEQTLTAGDGFVDDLFGFSVSIEGDFAVIGSLYSNNYEGATYVFRNFGGTWVETQKLLPLDQGGACGTLNGFGRHVDLDGSWLAVTADACGSDGDNTCP